MTAIDKRKAVSGVDTWGANYGDQGRSLRPAWAIH